MFENFILKLSFSLKVDAISNRRSRIEAADTPTHGSCSCGWGTPGPQGHSSCEGSSPDFYSLEIIDLFI